MNKNDIWVGVVGFEETHEVSSSGLIRRSIHSKAHDGTYPGRILKQEPVKGYMRVTLHRANKPHRYFVHRIVAEAFLMGRTPERTFVNHKNGIKDDNRSENLEWCTSSENARHAIDNGLWHFLGSKHHLAKLKESDVLEIRQKFSTGLFSRVEIGKQYAVSSVLVGLIVRRKIWKHV